MGPDEDSSRPALLSGKAVECLRFSPKELFAVEGWTETHWRKWEGVVNGAGNKEAQIKRLKMV